MGAYIGYVIERLYIVRFIRLSPNKIWKTANSSDQLVAQYMLVEMAKILTNLISVTLNVYERHVYNIKNETSISRR